MRDLVQLALPPKNSMPRAERVGSRTNDSTFSDALQVKSGKTAVTDGAEEGAADAMTASASALRIGAGSHGATRLPISVAVENKLFQHVAAEGAAGETLNGEGLSLPAELQAPDGEASGLAETAMSGSGEDVSTAGAVARAGLVIQPGPAPSLGGEAPDTGESPTPDKEARSSAEIATSGSDVDVPADRVARPESVIRSGRALSLSGDTANAGEAPDSPRAAATETAKAVGFAALAPAAPSPGQKAPAVAATGATTKPATAVRGMVEEIAAETADAGEPVAAARKALPLADRAQPPGERSPSETLRVPASVRVIDAHSLPAPGHLPSPASSVSQAITAAPDWMSFARSSATDAATAAPHAAASIKALTIQLHPAELGMVTAKLRFVGDQLTIELQVERGNAFEKLSADGETILKAVRALGIEVDRVTVQQQPAQSALNARSENSASFNSGGRETPFSAEGGSGRRESGTGGNPAGDGRDDAPVHASSAGNGNQSPNGRGVYI